MASGCPGSRRKPGAGRSPRRKSAGHRRTGPGWPSPPTRPASRSAPSVRCGRSPRPRPLRRPATTPIESRCSPTRLRAIARRACRGSGWTPHRRRDRDRPRRRKPMSRPESGIPVAAATRRPSRPGPATFAAHTAATSAPVKLGASGCRGDSGGVDQQRGAGAGEFGCDGRDRGPVGDVALRGAHLDVMPPDQRAQTRRARHRCGSTGLPCGRRVRCSTWHSAGRWLRYRR